MGVARPADVGAAVIALFLFLAVAGQDSDGVRRDLKRILDEPEFRENLPSDFWEKLREHLKLGDAEPPKVPNVNPPKPPNVNLPQPPAYTISLLKIVFIIAIALCGAFLILLIYKAIAGRVKEEETPLAPAAEAAEPAMPNALSQTADQWSTDAEQLFRQGKIAEAIRALYLAVLSFSHRRNWIDYHPCKTNGEYIRRFAGPPTGEGSLRTMTNLFERKWYGRETSSEADYLESKRLASEMSNMEKAPA